jgi:hypothetical protein
VSVLLVEETAVSEIITDLFDSCQIYYYVDKRSKIGKGLVMIRAIFDLYF